MISPCNGVCVLDPASGWCRGCLRTLDEIGGWSVMTEPEREAIMADRPWREARLPHRLEPGPSRLDAPPRSGG